jgi:hypothetical protein
MLRRMATDVKAGTVSVKPHVVEVTIPATRDAVTGESMPERVAQERREGFVAEMQSARLVSWGRTRAGAVEMIEAMLAARRFRA